MASAKDTGMALRRKWSPLLSIWQQKLHHCQYNRILDIGTEEKIIHKIPHLRTHNQAFTLVAPDKHFSKISQQSRQTEVIRKDR